jgi:UDP-N-acetylmuramoyl-L-alanyl-D-glutamate--2,6-diaminopimelate ligase
VFGCGGDRDSGKRPMMAQVAESLSDGILLTSDNPRGEDPLSIIRDMQAGLKNPEQARVVVDRATAIRQAVQECGSGDIVLVAGKGHETWQETNGRKVPFSDEAAVHAALEDVA